METTTTVKPELHPAFSHKSYLFRRKIFKLFGGAFHVYDPENNLAFYSKQKAFVLKEDFRIYSDQSCTEELLTIKTPHILDISAVYYVKEGGTDQEIGALKRKGLRSIFKDEWLILSKEGDEIGKLSETSLAAALVSRFINLVPQQYAITNANGEKIAGINQHFNPFVLKYTLSIDGSDAAIDPRLLIAAGILLAGIERRQR